MAIQVIPESKRRPFYGGLQRRMDGAMGVGKSFLKRKYIQLYDMGQNFDLAMQEAKFRGDKEVNWLALPKHEVCSTLVTSLYHEGFKACDWREWFLEELQKAIAATGDDMKVRGTQNIDPAALYLLTDKIKTVDPLFQILKVGEEIPDYSIIFCMSWAEPSERNMAQIIAGLVIAPFTFMSTFSRGIKVYQIEKKRPYPSYLITHVMMKVPSDKPGKIKVISQEAFCKFKYYSRDEFMSLMGGKRPRFYVGKPTFLA